MLHYINYPITVCILNEIAIHGVIAWIYEFHVQFFTFLFQYQVLKKKKSHSG